jgi:hypothetical protein
VEHSGDGKHWSTLGHVAAQGQSTREVKYSYHDSSPMSGQNVYRLKMVDRDGSWGYSPLRSVYFEGEGSLYPNPVSDKLHLSLSDWGKVSKVELYESGGRRVYESGERPSAEINVKGFAPGVYLVSIRYTGGTLRTYKVVVSH